MIEIVYDKQYIFYTQAIRGLYVWPLSLCYFLLKSN